MCIFTIEKMEMNKSLRWFRNERLNNGADPIAKTMKHEQRFIFRVLSFMGDE